jgi:hypothetical protein
MLAISLNWNKLAINLFGSSLSYSKIVLNGYSVLELSKLYDALGVLPVGFYHIDCIRHIIILQLRECIVLIHA